MIIQVYSIWVNQNTFGIYIKPEIIEEKTSFNLSFIEENVIFESDDDNSDSNYLSSDESFDDNKNEKKNDNVVSESPNIEDVKNLREELEKTSKTSKTSRKSRTSRTSKK